MSDKPSQNIKRKRSRRTVEEQDTIKKEQSKIRSRRYRDKNKKLVIDLQQRNNQLEAEVTKL